MSGRPHRLLPPFRAQIAPQVRRANDRIPIDVQRQGLLSVCTLLLLFGGCPKRQTTPRIVYVPSPPPQAAPSEQASQTNQQVLVIEEPAPPPETEQAAPQAPPAPQPSHHRRRAPRAATPADTETAPETVEEPLVEVPALEPGESGAQEAALRSKIQAMQDSVRQRMSRLNEARLTPTERKTLEDARTFFTQSLHALEGGDLQRALNLAHKASLLVSAVE